MEIKIQGYCEQSIEDDGTQPRVKAVETARNGQNLEVVETMDLGWIEYGCERKREVKGSSKSFDLSHWKDGVINRMAAESKTA